MLLMNILMCTGCDFQICGPAYPNKNGGKFLAEHGYSPEIIRVIVGRGILDHRQIVECTKISSTDVRFLVASNPHLTQDEIDLYINDKDDFARSGTACNWSLSKDQMLKLLRDKSHTVYCKLAENPLVPKDVLLKLHVERNPGLVWFATNPQCPTEIREEILKSKDDLAKQWLKIMDGWKKDGSCVRGQDGLWRTPWPQ